MGYEVDMVLAFTSSYQYFISLKMHRIGFLSLQITPNVAFTPRTLPTLLRWLLMEVSTVKYFIWMGFHLVLLPNLVQEGTF